MAGRVKPVAFISHETARPKTTASVLSMTASQASAKKNASSRAIKAQRKNQTWPKNKDKSIAGWRAGTQRMANPSAPQLTAAPPRQRRNQVQSITKRQKGSAETNNAEFS